MQVSNCTQEPVCGPLSTWKTHEAGANPHTQALFTWGPGSNSLTPSLLLATATSTELWDYKGSPLNKCFWHLKASEHAEGE